MHAAKPLAKVHEIRTVSLRPDHYHGWPTLAQRRNGQLLLICTGGREEHVCPFGQVELMRSDDDGKTWTYPRVLLDLAIDDRDAGILETDKGTLLATTFSSLAYEHYFDSGAVNNWDAHRQARWRGAHHRINAAKRKAQLGTWMLRSTDGGTTRLPMTIGGSGWGSFQGNCNEPVAEESVAGATYYLAIAVTSGTLSYRVTQ